MKIAIYDIIHLEQILPLISVVKFLNIPLVLFTDERFKQIVEQYDDFDSALVDVRYKSASKKEWEFINEVKKIIVAGKAEVFVLNSHDGKHLVWYRLISSLPGLKLLLNVHEVHNLFYSRFTFNFKRFVRHIGKKLLLSSADAFYVNTEAMKLYMQEKNLNRRPVFWIPAVVYHEKNPTFFDAQKPLVIVIPGTIDGRRRDYYFALDAYEELLQSSASIQLVFAGAPYGEYGQVIINKAKAINLTGGNIVIFENEIAENEFEQVLYRADFLWSPLQINTSIYDGIPEIYGQTKNSGNTHDAVRFAKPMIIPQQLQTAKEVEDSVLRYTDKKTFVSLILSLQINQDTVIRLQQNAIKNAKQFAIDKVASKFKGMLDGLSNSH